VGLILISKENSIFVVRFLIADHIEFKNFAATGAATSAGKSASSGPTPSSTRSAYGSIEGGAESVSRLIEKRPCRSTAKRRQTDNCNGRQLAAPESNSALAPPTRAS
jgi:hypothetical protein